MWITGPNHPSTPQKLRVPGFGQGILGTSKLP